MEIKRSSWNLLGSKDYQTSDPNVHKENFSIRTPRFWLKSSIDDFIDKIRPVVEDTVEI